MRDAGRSLCSIPKILKRRTVAALQIPKAAPRYTHLQIGLTSRATRRRMASVPLIECLMMRSSALLTTEVSKLLSCFPWDREICCSNSRMAYPNCASDSLPLLRLRTRTDTTSAMPTLRM